MKNASNAVSTSRASLWPRARGDDPALRLRPGPAAWRRIRGAALAPLVLVTLASLLCACEEEALFIDCPFDKAITDSCASVTEEGTMLTCVVEKHPQCPEDVCISWKGASAVCTRVCALDGDCPSGAFCATYDALAQKRYCVPTGLGSN